VKTGERVRAHLLIRMAEMGSAVDVIENANLPVYFRGQLLGLNADVSASPELEVKRSPKSFEGRGRYGADPRRRLGNNRAEGLDKAGQLGRFQAETLIESHAAKRARVNSSQGNPIGRAIDQGRFRTEQIFGLLA